MFWLVLQPNRRPEGSWGRGVGLGLPENGQTGPLHRYQLAVNAGRRAHGHAGIALPDLCATLECGTERIESSLDGGGEERECPQASIWVLSSGHGTDLPTSATMSMPATATALRTLLNCIVYTDPYSHLNGTR